MKLNRPFSNFKLPLTTTTPDSICTVLASIWSYSFLNATVVLHYMPTLRIVGGVTSHFLSLVFWIFNNKTRLRLYKMSLQSFKSVATRNSKLICYFWYKFKQLQMKLNHLKNYWKCSEITETSQEEIKINWKRLLLLVI